MRMEMHSGPGRTFPSLCPVGLTRNMTHNVAYVIRSEASRSLCSEERAHLPPACQL